MVAPMPTRPSACLSHGPGDVPGAGSYLPGEKGGTAPGDGGGAGAFLPGDVKAYGAVLPDIDPDAFITDEFPEKGKFEPEFLGKDAFVPEELAE